MRYSCERVGRQQDREARISQRAIAAAHRAHEEWKKLRSKGKKRCTR